MSVEQHHLHTTFEVAMQPLQLQDEPQQDEPQVNSHTNTVAVTPSGSLPVVAHSIVEVNLKKLRTHMTIWMKNVCKL